MSIEKRGNQYVPVCDVCGAELCEQEKWDSARRFLLDSGWRRRRDEDGSYIDICEDCQEEADE